MGHSSRSDLWCCAGTVELGWESFFRRGQKPVLQRSISDFNPVTCGSLWCMVTSHSNRVPAQKAFERFGFKLILSVTWLDPEHITVEMSDHILIRF